MTRDAEVDAQLLREARGGSERAFEALVRRHQGMLRGFLRRLAGDAALADDLAQATFVTAWQRLGAFDGRGTVRGWLCRIAWTRFLQDRRARQRAQARDDIAMREAETVTDPALASDARLDLDRLLGLLAPDERASLALCHGAGMSHAEAAEALGIPLGTVKSHVLRGQQKILAHLARVPTP